MLTHPEDEVEDRQQQFDACYSHARRLTSQSAGHFVHSISSRTTTNSNSIDSTDRPIGGKITAV